ncbi:MAG TPA: transporter, partial [Gammaproteobacteria bacterium]|nr:transporter [Gammaproteobacteria bacterium]
MYRTQLAALTVAAAALLVAWPFRSALAQDLEPRLYTNVPIGINFLGAGYGYSEGNVLFDPTIPLDNAAIEIDGPVLGYGRSVRLG